MELEDVMLKRRSIRKFKDEDVDSEKLLSLAYFAMAAPSARNTRPWEFYLIKNKELQEKLKQVSPAYNYNSNAIIIVAVDISKDKDGKDGFSIQDAASAINYILLEATNLGLGSVWCGLYPKEDRVKAVKETLNLGENINPIGLIHIGYADEEKEARSQFEEEKIHIIK